jgi:transcriptional regulator with XRE-family HTH domain
MAGLGAHAENTPPVVVANRLQVLRSERGWSRRKVALDLGITEATLYRWESLRQAIPDERKMDLARYYGVSIDVLMGWPPDRPPEAHE